MNDQTVKPLPSEVMPESELSDRELLANALQEAMDA